MCTLACIHVIAIWLMVTAHDIFRVIKLKLENGINVFFRLHETNIITKKNLTVVFL